MKHLALILVFALAATSVSAECYADFKAKQDNPLRLIYGVVQLSDGVCGDAGAAEAEVNGRVAAGGFQLVKLLSIFGPDALDQKKADAGEFFLRF